MRRAPPLFLALLAAACGSAPRLRTLDMTASAVQSAELALVHARLRAQAPAIEEPIPAPSTTTEEVAEDEAPMTPDTRVGDAKLAEEESQTDELAGEDAVEEEPLPTAVEQPTEEQYQAEIKAMDAKLRDVQARLATQQQESELLAAYLAIQMQRITLTQLLLAATLPKPPAAAPPAATPPASAVRPPAPPLAPPTTLPTP